MFTSRLPFLLILAATLAGCHPSPKNSTSMPATNSSSAEKIRPVVDTVGFAHLDWQMDSIIARLTPRTTIDPKAAWKTVIAPHDDYKYAGEVEYQALSGIRAPVVILFGVAHKASMFHLENRIVFGSFTHWKGPYGNVRISPLQQDIEAKLPKDLWLVHDSMQLVEHSLEALIPFLQYENHDVQIIPVIVPFMDFARMQEIAGPLSQAIFDVMKEKNLTFGRDIAIAISTDGVHYGDEEWGGKNMAPFGCDSAGNAKATQLDHEIIDNCLVGGLSTDKVKRFTEYTVQADNFRDYKWTWCGRYSIPLGLLTANGLNEKTEGQPLSGTLLGYASSIDHEHFPVEDLRMGITAVATPHHWVSYIGMGYE
jgi:AmmeMemoRadiSam system protein B